jgi:hypothetical protein
MKYNIKMNLPESICLQEMIYNKFGKEALQIDISTLSSRIKRVQMNCLTGILVFLCDLQDSDTETKDIDRKTIKLLRSYYDLPLNKLKNCTREYFKTLGFAVLEFSEKEHGIQLGAVVSVEISEEEKVLYYVKHIT